MSDPKDDELGEPQDLVEHLTELRERLIRSLVTIIIGSIVCYNFSDALFDIIRAPIQPFLPNKGLIFTAPMDKFFAHIKISILAGVILTTPIWLYQVYMFIAPGLYAKERKYSLGFIFSGTVLFLLGVSFVYFVVYPLAFDFLMNFGGGTDQAFISISEYLSFFFTTTLLFGAAFQMPLILVILGMMGVIDKAFLSSKRRYAIVVIAIASAFLTPPDPFSMAMLMLPLALLYEISIVMVGLLGQKPGTEEES